MAPRIDAEDLMPKARMIALAVLASWLAASSTATAQRWGRERTPDDGVCFYKDRDYRGDYFCARSGESLSFVPDGLNDRISSMRIFGRADVTVFSEERFSGRSTRFNGDVRDLKDEGWNDRISAIRVEGRRGGGSGSSSGYRGDPDRVVRRAYQDILDREPDSQGLRLYRSRMIDDGWTEADVRDALRKSPEYREKNTMTREKASEVVRRAYRAVLGREPDAGSSGYVDRVLRDKWTQSDVERELRKSPEYRGRR
jgi:hypothetical protein